MISGLSKQLTVHQGGVDLLGLPYGGPELLPLRKRYGGNFKAFCKWDPDDLSLNSRRVWRGVTGSSNAAVSSACRRWSSSDRGGAGKTAMPCRYASCLVRTTVAVAFCCAWHRATGSWAESSAAVGTANLWLSVARTAGKTSPGCDPDWTSVAAATT